MQCNLILCIFIQQCLDYPLVKITSLCPQNARDQKSRIPLEFQRLKDALKNIEALKAPDFDTYAQWVTKHVALQKQMQSKL